MDQIALGLEPDVRASKPTMPYYVLGFKPNAGLYIHVLGKTHVPRTSLS